MWYIFGTGWKRFAPGATIRTYKIGHAVSKNGVEWVKEEARQIIGDRLGPDESQALPTVVQIGERHHMFFCYRESFDFRTANRRGYRIGHAYSDDLLHWTRDDACPQLEIGDGEWDSEMQCYPHAFECDGRSTCSTTATNSAGMASAWRRSRPRHERSLGQGDEPGQRGTDCRAPAPLRRWTSSRRCTDRIDVGQLCPQVGVQGRAIRGVGGRCTRRSGRGLLQRRRASRGFITSVSVLRDWQGRRIASRLLEQAIAHVRALGFEHLELEVDRGNAHAIALYEKTNFIAGPVHGQSMTMHLDT